MKRSLLVALIVLAALGTAAWADLPPPEPPTPPAVRPKGLLLRRSANDTSTSNENESNHYQPPRVQQDELELDILMKCIGDPRLPMPDDWEQQVTSMFRVTHVGMDRLAQRVEELLLMLENVTPLRDGANASRWQVRHRAAVALSAISHVWFGHLPTCPPGEALTAEQQEDARRIINQWHQWWKEAAPMDPVQRRDLAHRLRMPLLESGNLDLVWPNLIHAHTDRDVRALPVMAKTLLEIDPMTLKAQKLISFYGNLCRSNLGAPRDAALRLVEFLRKNNQPNAIHRCPAVQQAAFYVQQISGVSMEYQKPIEAPPGETDAGGHTYIIDPQALDAWEKAIKAKADAPVVKGDPDEEESEDF